MRWLILSNAALVVTVATACSGPTNWSVSSSQQAREHAEKVAGGGADPDKLVGDGKPALFAAVESRDCDSAATLLEHGADAQGTWLGWTPLQASCSSGDGRCAALLLRHGADPNHRVRGASPLFLATMRGDGETIRMLVAGGARVDVAYSREFPIQVAAEGGHADAVRALLEGGADPNTRGPAGSNPMHLAAAAGHDEAAAVLLDAGSRLTEIPSEPWTTARTFTWAAGYRRQQGDTARGAELDGIACEYFPIAVADLSDDGREHADELAEAEEATLECESRAGEGGIAPPPWSPPREPSPL